jgi:adenosine deaminase
MDRTEDILFKEGLKEENLLKLKKVSKGDVHNHCTTGMRFSSFNKWAGGNANQAPKKMNGVKELNEYISNEVNKRVSKEEDVAFLIEETVKEAIEDGVKILETSIDCHELMHFPEKDNFFKTILNIKDRYKTHIDFRPEIGMAITTPREDLDKYLIPGIESGVFMSIDAYGEETIEGYKRLKEYYKYAREKGLKLKVHAGQFLSEENVRTAIELLEVDEIQHGIGAASSEYIMDLIKERNLRLNVCPSSNYILGAVKDITKHPARKLYDNGINITINTDDLLLFDRGVSEEFLYLYKVGLFNEEELNEIRKRALDM